MNRRGFVKRAVVGIGGLAAIGGVVNIITKKNYNGAEISGRVGFPTQETSNDLLEYRASVVAGASSCCIPRSASPVPHRIEIRDSTAAGRPQRR